ncbi:MAG TPA: YggS family pyridoxal phosphate-dependent enzyme [Anaerolineae bacterium]|jgi:hypothetical protein
MSQPQSTHTIAQSLAIIRERINTVAQRAGRSASEITLVAVSKTFPVQAIREAIAAGQVDFGENRVEEAAEKIREIGGKKSEVRGQKSEVRSQRAESEAGDQRSEVRGQRAESEARNQKQEDRNQEAEVRWHLIGHLQSRKVRDAVGLFDLIHSVDSLKLATAINQRIHISNLESQIASPQSLLLECNISGEATKSGFALAGWTTNHAVRDAFLRDVEQMAQLPNVRLRGLMTIAPVFDAGHPDQARQVFAQLRQLRDALRIEFPQIAWEHLSMGMSDDFEAAIAEGATLVRLGRAIFGERTYA